MGCCNQKRAHWNRSVAPPRSTMTASAETAAPIVRELALTRTIAFEYVGETAMSVLGPITRTRYRFRGTGARVPIDHRDAPYVSAVPNLRRMG